MSQAIREAYLEKARAHYEAARNILGKLEKEGRDPTAEEKAKIDVSMLGYREQKELADVHLEIERAEKYFDQPIKMFDGETVLDAAGFSVDEAARLGFKTELQLEPSALGQLARELRAQGFGNVSIREFANAEHRVLTDLIFAKGNLANVNQKTYSAMEKKAITRLTDVSGGFHVGSVVQQEIIAKLVNYVWFRQIGRVIRSDSAKVEVPAAQFTAAMQQHIDNGTLTALVITDLAGMLTLTAWDYSAIVKVPQSWIEDQAVDVLAWLIEQFVQQSGTLDEALFINGNGVKKPTGILQCGITTYDVETTTSAAIVAEDIQKAPYKLTAVYRKNAVFVMPRTYVEKAMLLRDNSGGAGTGRFLWQPSFQAGQPALLVNRPLYETEFWPTISANDDPIFVFGDFSQFIILDRKTITVKVLTELYQGDSQIGYKFDKRLDSMVRDVNAFTVCVRT